MSSRLTVTALLFFGVIHATNVSLADASTVSNSALKKVESLPSAGTISSSAAVCTNTSSGEECSADDGGSSSSLPPSNLREAATVTCQDEHEKCREWAEAGECKKNPGFMLSGCRTSCFVCLNTLGITDFGEDQLMPPGNEQDVRDVIESTLHYMRSVVLVNPEYEHVRYLCRNKEARCSPWAIGTGCDDNPRYMKVNCAPACRSCDYLLNQVKECKLDPNASNAVVSGGLDGMFERIVREADRAGYSPSVLSRPQPTGECGHDVTHPCVPDGPWVVTLENFLGSEEIETLKVWGALFRYERSQAGDEITNSRTSSQTWCNEKCYDDPTVVDIRRRVVQLTGVHEDNYESFQLLQYEPGQYYRQHNDFIEKHCEQAHGPRLITFFCYFNAVEKGGGTSFPHLNNLTVQPAPGRILIWPSVLNEDVSRMDTRTDHEALPVEAGEKFSANLWIHLRDFQTPFKAGCPS